MTPQRITAAMGIPSLFVAFTAVMTWPQAVYLASRATQHQDVYFNMWRLRWFAHAVVTPGTALFNANIFFPETRTLALSDAMLVEGTVAAPLNWLGIQPLLVHNLMLLGGITLSGLAMFALAKHLTGSRGAGVLAGLVFAYAPYRFEHFMHMELQWAMWSPLAFLFLHRTCETGRLRDGLGTGACVALQMLSSIYYGIFLATLLGLGALFSLWRDRSVPLQAAVKSLVAGAFLAAIVCTAYAIPYLRAHERVGDRPIGEVATFSATPGDYLSATESNWLYGVTARRGWPERHLFPGALPIILAMVGLLLRVPGRRTILYLLLLVAAFEGSLGSHSLVYPALYNHVPLYRGLRAAARLGIFVLLFLGVLTAYGYQALAAAMPRARRFALAAACAAVILAEYHVTVPLVEFEKTAPPIYKLLASQPIGVLAEFPVATPSSLPGWDPLYAYMSIFHWFPLVNGYSGMYPPSYINRLERIAHFPDATSLKQLRADTVRYVIVHQNGYRPADLSDLLSRIDQTGAFVQLGSFPDSFAEAWLYRLR